MKIVVTTTGKSLDAPLDPRFGRASGFLVYDLENGGFEVIDNRNANAAHGAGIQAAENVVRSGAQAVVTGHCGPKAFQVLRAAGVSVFNTDAATVADAIALYREGKLSRALSADTRGHGA